MKKPGLTRRRFLRGLLGGSAVAVSLPSLEFFSRRGTALAAETSFPKRYVQFFWGNGILPERWIPEDSGVDFTLSEQLAPLAPIKSEVSVLTGYEVKVPNNVAHFSGAAGLFTGMANDGMGEDYTFAGPSLDQLLASSIGGLTAYRSLEVGVQPGASGMSYNGPGSKNPPISSPMELFERLFGSSFREPGEDGAVDPTLALRRSVLDAVMEDMNRLNSRLGASDKIRLDQHLSSVRDLEQRIARLMEDPPDYAACVRPGEPIPLPDIDGRPQMAERARVMADLTAMAMACDLTRVVSFWYSDALNDLLYEGATAGHHQLTHDEPGEQPMVHDIVLEAVQAFTDLTLSLQNVPEGEGTLLDNSVVFGSTEVSYGRTHQIDEIPILLAGRAGGAITPVGHLRSSTKDNASKVPLTLLRAMDVPAASFGTEDAFSEDGVSEVER